MSGAGGGLSEIGCWKGKGDGRGDRRIKGTKMAPAHRIYTEPGHSPVNYQKSPWSASRSGFVLER